MFKINYKSNIKIIIFYLLVSFLINVCLFADEGSENSAIDAADTIDIGADEYFEPGIYLDTLGLEGNALEFGHVALDHAKTKNIVLGVKDNSTFSVTIDSVTVPDSMKKYYNIDEENILPHTIIPGDTLSIPIEFCTNEMFRNCSALATIFTDDPYVPEVTCILTAAPALDQSWNWISFPELVREANEEQDAEEVMEPLEPDAVELLHKGTSMEYNILDSTWSHNYLDSLNSTKGYKLEMTNTYDYYPFEVYDSITVCDPTTEFTLEPDCWNWVGYFIPESQNIDEAFYDEYENNRFDDIIAIKAENWYYHKPFEDPHKSKDFGQSEPVPSNTIRPLHYGRSYLVELEDGVSTFTAHWNNPDQSEGERFVKNETETFSYDEKKDYEAIDVIELDGSIVEIGAFQGDQCVGSAVVKDSCAQILAYTDTNSKYPSNLTFQVTYSGKSIKKFSDYLVYDTKIDTFVTGKIIVGKQDYSIVKLVKGNENDVEAVSLSQNNPNPFNPIKNNTSISYSLPNASQVKLTIYNVKGQKVKTLIDSDVTAGAHNLSWDGTNSSNNIVASGIYFYRLETTDKNVTKKMLLIK